jgi:hypothetical protein
MLDGWMVPSSPLNCAPCLEEIGLCLHSLLIAPHSMVNIIARACEFSKGINTHALPLIMINLGEVQFEYGLVDVFIDNATQISKCEYDQLFMKEKKNQHKNILVPLHNDIHIMYTQFHNRTNVFFA